MIYLIHLGYKGKLVFHRFIEIQGGVVGLYICIHIFTITSFIPVRVNQQRLKLTGIQPRHNFHHIINTVFDAIFLNMRY